MQKNSWQPRALGIIQYPYAHQVFASNQNSQWNTPMPWQTWSPQPSEKTNIGNRDGVFTYWEGVLTKLSWANI